MVMSRLMHVWSVDWMLRPETVIDEVIMELDKKCSAEAYTPI